MAKLIQKMPLHYADTLTIIIPHADIWFAAFGAHFLNQGNFNHAACSSAELRSKYGVIDPRRRFTLIAF